MAYRNITKRTPRSPLPSLARMLQRLNDTIPLLNTRDLIEMVGGEACREKGSVLIGQRSVETLQLYSGYNERVKTLFVRLEGSMDLEGARELVKRLKRFYLRRSTG